MRSVLRPPDLRPSASPAMEVLSLEQVRRENTLLLHLVLWSAASLVLVAFNVMTTGLSNPWSFYTIASWGTVLLVHGYLRVVVGRRRYEEKHRRLEVAWAASGAIADGTEPTEVEELRQNLLRAAEDARQALRRISGDAAADVSRGESRALEIVSWLAEAEKILQWGGQARELRRRVAAALSRPGGELQRQGLEKLLTQLDLQDVKAAAMEREVARRRSMLESFLLVIDSAGVAQESSDVLAAVSAPLRERVELLEGEGATEANAHPAPARAARETERIREEMRMAQDLQRSILPAGAPAVTGLSVAQLCCPSSEVGGDYFDFYRLDPERLLIAIGDASGHGLDSSMVSSMAKSALYTQVSASRSLEQSMAEMNRLMFDTLGKRRLMTLALLEIDARDHRLSWVNAGQVFPLLRRGNEVLELGKSGYPLGVRRETRYESQEMELEADDLLLLFTDGLFEAARADGTIYGWDRAVQRLRDLEVSDVQAVVDHMADDLWEHLGDTPLPDDITIIALRVEP